MTLRVTIAGLGLLALSGCAYNTAERIVPGDTETDGVRVYDCKPLVLIQDGALSIIYVPDPSRATALQFGAFLAKNETSIEFGEHCGIKKIDSKQDSTDALKIIEAALNKVPTRGFVGGAESGAVGGRAELYEIVFDADGGIVGLKPVYGRGVRH